MGPGQHETDQDSSLSSDKKISSSRKKTMFIFFVLALVFAIAFAGWKWKGQLDEYRTKVNEMDQEISKLEKQLASQNQAKDGLYSTSQFSFKIPEGWVVSKKSPKVPQSNGDTPLDSYTITNPTTGFTVEYTSGPGGLGGGCDEDQQIQQKIVGSKKMSNERFSEETYYAEKLALNTSDRYTVWFGVTNSIDVSGRVCENTSYMITTLTDTSDNIFFFGGGLTGYSQEFSTEADALSFFKSSDYLAAKAMILSLK